MSEKKKKIILPEDNGEESEDDVNECGCGDIEDFKGGPR